jgi:anti-sigma B factor antagonist
MPSDLFVNSHTNGRATTLTVSGELDLVSSPVLERALVESDAKLIVVDLRGLEFMDSSGLHVLIEAHQGMRDAGRRLVLVRAPEKVQRVFNLTGVSDALTIVDSPDEALARRAGDHASRPEASRGRRAR